MLSVITQHAVVPSGRIMLHYVPNAKLFFQPEPVTRREKKCYQTIIIFTRYYIETLNQLQ